jgi:EAL domain-containing protein (putative c-di-GMP-specific phosphodiesterase class I)
MSVYHTGLDKAVEDFFLRQEFQLNYQPVLSLDQKQIGGFEALLQLRQHRAHHYPPDFIPLIEETSLRTPLARWVLREACHQVQFWQKKEAHTPVSVSVNLSPRQLRQGHGLIQELENALSDTGLNPTNLQLEVPETATYDTPLLVETLAGLKQLGVQLYIDNFVPTQGSLETLAHLPVDAIKICHHSLKGLERVLDNLKTTIHLADDLGVQVIAKRIETPLQLAKLQSCGFRYGQGFLFAKPVTSREASALVAASGQFIEFDLATHVSCMNKLSRFLHRFLGLMVYRYWHTAKPDKAWLAPLTPLPTGTFTTQQAMPAVIDLLQQQDLNLWVKTFVGQCRKVLPHLTTMLIQENFTPKERMILGL